MVTLSSVQPKVAVESDRLPGGLRRRREGHHLAVGQDAAIVEVDNLTENAIDGATSATYTPVAGDVDQTPTPMFLAPRPAYTDRQAEHVNRC